jgi:hypothetical protein
MAENARNREREGSGLRRHFGRLLQNALPQKSRASLAGAKKATYSATQQQPFMIRG